MIYAVVESLVADHIVVAAWMLQGLCFGRYSLGTKRRVFPVKVASAGDERYLVCVRRLRAVRFDVCGFLLCVLQWLLRWMYLVL